jgi:hypothetical protein
MGRRMWTASCREGVGGVSKMEFNALEGCRIWDKIKRSNDRGARLEA